MTHIWVAVASACLCYSTAAAHGLSLAAPGALWYKILDLISANYSTFNIISLAVYTTRRESFLYA